MAASPATFQPGALSSPAHGAAGPAAAEDNNRHDLAVPDIEALSRSGEDRHAESPATAGDDEGDTGVDVDESDEDCHHHHHPRRRRPELLDAQLSQVGAGADACSPLAAAVDDLHLSSDGGTSTNPVAGPSSLDPLGSAPIQEGLSVAALSDLGDEVFFPGSDILDTGFEVDEEDPEDLLAAATQDHDGGSSTRSSTPPLYPLPLPPTPPLMPSSATSEGKGKQKQRAVDLLPPSRQSMSRPLEPSDPGWEAEAGRPPTKLPIRFQDALGRYYVFPWEKAKTYEVGVASPLLSVFVVPEGRGECRQPVLLPTTGVKLSTGYGQAPRPAAAFSSYLVWTLPRYYLLR